MESRNAPTADAPMLAFMLTALAIVGALAGTLAWLQQPTVLRATEITHQAPGTPPLVLPTSSALAIELAERSTTTADKANAELGLERQQLAGNDQTEPAAKPQATAKVTPKAKPKPRQVARKQAPVVAERRPWPPVVAERRSWPQDQRGSGGFWFGGPRSFFN